jgi:hypothetical protein
LGVVLFVLAVLGTLFGAFHLIENWRGKRRWEAYKQTLIAQREELDLAAYVPPPIPVNHNFAATPFFADLFPGPKPTNWNSKYWPEAFGRLSPETTGKRNERSITDVSAWLRAIRGGTNDIASHDDRAKTAAEVLVALNAYEPALDELRRASQRPLSRYDVYYDLNNPWGIRLPHLATIKEVARLISLKACLELAAGNSDRAMEDVRLLARLTQSMDSELFLINYVVKVSVLQLLLQPVWEGLALQRWSDAHLEELQRTMLAFNFIEHLETPLKAERAAGIITVDILLKQRYRGEFLDALTGRPGSNAGVKNVLAWLVPRGWYRMEQYEFARLYQDLIIPGSDGINRVVHPGFIEGNQAQLSKALRPGWRAVLQHRLMAGLLMPAVGKIHRRSAEAQTAVHQAAIACAMERYRRRHGEYPMELTQLAPAFIGRVPHDVIGGKPMRYINGERFVLYSVGWDEKDNGGMPGKVLWDEQGDWVWTYSQ